MLLNGLDHLAVLTSDTDRLHAFYSEVFDAQVVRDDTLENGTRLSFVQVGDACELNVFEIPGNPEASRPAAMFARGRLDHFGLRATSLDAFLTVRQRLIARGAADAFVTDFGPVLSVFFRDPDGLEGEVCVASPTARSGVFHPPGTPARGLPAHHPHPSHEELS